LRLAEAQRCATRECARERGAFIARIGSAADSEAERIPLIEQQRRIRVDEGPPPDGGNAGGGGAAPPVARPKGAADDALLHPLFAFRELAVRGEARELGARARATGRT